MKNTVNVNEHLISEAQKWMENYENTDYAASDLISGAQFLISSFLEHIEE